MPVTPAEFRLHRSAPRFKSPRQRNLFPPPDDSRPMRATDVDQYAAGNRRAAQIIVESPAKYGGLMAEWAQLVLQRGARPEAQP